MKKGRSLTKGEIALARTIFGDSIDYDAVKIHEGKFMPFHPPHTGMAPNGHLYMNGCYTDDYAIQEPVWRGLFIHEMTHVWQFQNKVLEPIATAMKLSMRHKFNYGSSYKYKLDGRKDLLEFNMEQQATIVQDYFLLKHENEENCSGHCKNSDAPKSEKIAHLEKNLANFIKNPAYAKRTKFPSVTEKFRPPKKS